MAQNNAVTIGPITARDLETAAEGHNVDVDKLRHALSATNQILAEFGNQIADQEIPDGHGEFTEPTVVTKSDEYVCIYVSYGTVAREADEHPDIGSEMANAVGWAHNAFARRHGASPDALGTMDAAVLPRTETVDQIIEERE